MTQALVRQETTLPAMTTHQADHAMKIVKLKDCYEVERGALKVTLKHGEHYGPPFPGSKKDSLLLPGGEFINKILGARWAKPVLDERIFDFDRGFFFFSYSVDLVDTVTGEILSTGMASCSTYEEAFRFRNNQRVCPSCNVESIMKSKYPDRDTGDIGWYCNKNKGGCGGNFRSDDPAITQQESGKKENPNPAHEISNVQQRAIKRARLQATRQFGCLSGVFDQDADDYTRDVITARATVIDEPFDPKTGEILAEPADSAVPAENHKGATSPPSRGSAPSAPSAPAAAPEVKQQAAAGSNEAPFATPERGRAEIFTLLNKAIEMKIHGGSGPKILAEIFGDKAMTPGKMQAVKDVTSLANAYENLGFMIAEFQKEAK